MNEKLMYMCTLNLDIQEGIRKITKYSKRYWNRSSYFFSPVSHHKILNFKQWSREQSNWIVLDRNNPGWSFIFMKSTKITTKNAICPHPSKQDLNDQFSSFKQSESIASNEGGMLPNFSLKCGVLIFFLLFSTCFRNSLHTTILRGST